MSPAKQDQDDEAPPGTESISIEQVLTDDDRQRIDEAHENIDIEDGVGPSIEEADEREYPDEDEEPDRVAIMGRNTAERSFWVDS